MTVNIYENHVCALRLKKRIWAILAVMNTTELVVEIRSEKKKKKKTQCHFVRQIVHATRIVGLLLPGGSS